MSNCHDNIHDNYSYKHLCYSQCYYFLQYKGLNRYYYMHYRKNSGNYVNMILYRCKNMILSKSQCRSYMIV